MQGWFGVSEKVGKKEREGEGGRREGEKCTKVCVFTCMCLFTCVDLCVCMC